MEILGYCLGSFLSNRYGRGCAPVLGGCPLCEADWTYSSASRWVLSVGHGRLMMQSFRRDPGIFTVVAMIIQ